MSRSVVYKYDLPMPAGTSDAPVVSVTTHRGARVVHQHGQPRVWAVVDPEEPLAELRLLVLGTGWDVPGLDLSKWEHLGTLMLYHVFQEIAH